MCASAMENHGTKLGKKIQCTPAHGGVRARRRRPPLRGVAVPAPAQRAGPTQVPVLLAPLAHLGRVLHPGRLAAPQAPPRVHGDQGARGPRRAGRRGQLEAVPTPQHRRQGADQEARGAGLHGRGRGLIIERY